MTINHNIEDPLLKEIVRRLAEAFQPVQIFLFGSRAQGDFGPDSDYDLVVIVDNDAPPERQRSRLAYQVLRGTGIATDIIVYTKQYFNARLHLAASLPAIIQREGRLLYAR